MSRPKVSIIVLSYNQRNTIGRALDSILRQRCSFPYEIIIGDDASTDGTRAICEEYAARYHDIIRLMPAAPNKGVVDNYFDCLLECRGQYISDCAGDDEWGDIDRMQLQTEYLDAHPEDIAVISDWIIDIGGKRTNTSDMEAYSSIRKRVAGYEMLRTIFVLDNGFIFISAMTFRRKPLVEAYSRNPNNLRRREWGCEDTPVACALAAAGAYGYLPLTASVYYHVDGSVSRRKNLWEEFDFTLGMVSCDLDLCSIYGVEQQEIASKLIPLVRYVVGLAFKLHKKESTARLMQFMEDFKLRLPLVSRIKLLLLRLLLYK